jgi:hypothetical protein
MKRQKLLAAALVLLIAAASAAGSRAPLAPPDGALSQIQAKAKS